MDIAGEHRIAAARQVVWNALNDTAVLQACIPGCEELQRLSDTILKARVLVQLGPVKSIFTTHITLNELNPPTSYTIVGEGNAGSVGSGRGEARVRLAEEGAMTLLTYTVDLKLRGKLAQLGARLLEGATRQLANDFFASFAMQLDADAHKVLAPERPAAAVRRRSWLVGGAVLGLGLLIWLLARIW